MKNNPPNLLAKVRDCFRCSAARPSRLTFDQSPSRCFSALFGELEGHASRFTSHFFAHPPSRLERVVCFGVFCHGGVPSPLLTC